MNTDTRLAAGHVSVVTITGSSSYLIKNFTKPSDVGAANPWKCNTVPPHAAVRKIALSSKVTGQGYYLSSLTFKVFTFGMRDYFKDTFYAGSETSYSANVTAALYTASNEVFYMQCTMIMPDWGELARSGQQIAIGYRDVVWQLTTGVQIT